MKKTWDGQVLLIKNFLSIAECDVLNSWCKEAILGGQFADGITGDWVNKNFSTTDRRLTNRMNTNIEYCSLIYETQQKIRSSITSLKDAPVINDHGKDGVVVSVTYNGGDVYLHKDPSVGEGLSGIRCNILSSKPESGGLIHVANATYDINQGDLMAYAVTDLFHKVEPCFGTIPRILFMFGFCLPTSKSIV
jgi:hypothetical protein